MSTEKSYLKPYAQKLRQNMTSEELKLYNGFLRRLPFTVRRQKPIGPYIVDFYVAAQKAVIEVDGSQHYEEAGAAADLKRDQFLMKKGLTVLRYSNSDINRHFTAVCEDIMRRFGLEEVRPE